MDLYFNLITSHELRETRKSAFMAQNSEEANLITQALRDDLSSDRWTIEGPWPLEESE